MFNLFKKKVVDESLDDQAKDLEDYPLGLRDRATAGLSCDLVPNTSGEFGRCLTNPIPVNGPMGEIKYISRLMTRDGGLIAHRLGSVGELDIYEVVSIGGKVWDILYFDMYHPRRSTLAPSNFRINEFHEAFVKLAFGYSANSFDPDFPFGLSEHIEKRIGGTLGGRIAKKYEEVVLDKTKFTKPESHILKLKQIKLTGRLA